MQGILWGIGLAIAAKFCFWLVGEIMRQPHDALHADRERVAISRSETATAEDAVS